jgi:uncharacterized protein with FMN-binding domain
MTQGGSNKKVANGLVALSSAAVLAVYAAGFVRTRPAAERFAQQAEERRPPMLPSPSVAPPVVDAQAAPVVVGPTMATPVPTESLVAAALPAKLSSKLDEAAIAERSQVLAVVSMKALPVPAPFEVKAEGPSAAPVAAVAPVAIATSTAPVAPVAPAAVWRDGTYTGWGNSRHGSIQASVVIESGRIASATIAQCLTRYSCSVIDKLPPEVPQRQSPEVDYVSGATQSADAFYYAVVEALSKAK